jgi:glycosyltransferase involved in cell wall biosynthesis
LQTVVIFRHQLFRRTEPFIADQAQRIRRFKLLYAGRERLGAVPRGAESVTLSELATERPYRSRVWQAISRDPRPYLRLMNGRPAGLVHAHFGADAVYALPLAKRLDVPLVTTFHGYDATMTVAALLRAGKPTWWNYVLHRGQLAERGELFLCVSEYIRRRVLALGFPEARTRVHYIGVDTETIRPRGQHSARPMILHVARLVEKKGTVDLIAAFARVATKIADAELVIVGEGPLEAALRRQAKELGVTPTVRFLGTLPHAEVLDLLGQAWLLALPSVKARSGDAEGLGMVLLESAASGVPVVACQHGGIPEVVVDGETGCLCPEHDVAALAAAMTDVLQDEKLRRRMGDAARQRAERHFNLERQCAALEEIYDEVVGTSA